MDFLLDTSWVLCYSSQRWSTIIVQFTKGFGYLPIYNERKYLARKECVWIKVTLKKEMNYFP